ncbi:uncharacterized protein LOC122366071 [Amphibalanus amphitrite]|uniref:uncharacterized protein LOC122366071 n=1 Tax=Amphibalanus amphitrite TaxID=1232801 RepID=UPI001C8FD4CD|nr:uncharacterized protein LOC122366071 [Amphibalanus amphitrite]
MDSEITERELIELERSVVPDNTSKATQYGMKKFNEWLALRDHACDFGTVTHEELCSLLRRFYAEVKAKKAGETLTPSTLTCIRAAIHRCLTSAPHSRPINIITDREFIAANNIFDARCKLYVKAGNPKPQHKAAITEDDMKRLGDYLSDFASNPTILLQATWFYLCFFFGRRGREGWAQMRKDHFVIREDPDGKEYVTISKTEATKNHQGGSKQGDVDFSDQRMYGPGVEVFKMYQQKINHNSDRLFQTPKRAWTQDECWFRNEAMGKNSLSTIMQRIADSAKLSQRYTCHSVRATTVTTLHQAGVAAEDIVKVTKHKRTASLSHYIDDMSVPQKRRCSEILAQTMTRQSDTTASVVQGCSATVIQNGGPATSRRLCEEKPNFNLTIGGMEVDDWLNMNEQEHRVPDPSEVRQSQQLVTARTALSSLLPNATFNGSCVINVNFHA